MKAMETGRLILRAWSLDDLNDFFEMASGPNVGPNAGWKPHENKADSLATLNRFIDKDETWAVVEKASGKAVGAVGLHKDDKRDFDGARMLGFMLNQSYWGRGYMTEAAERALEFAFDDMGLAIVSACYFPGNHRSRRVIEKLGLRHEGVLRMCGVLYNGMVCDEICCSITREEYAKRWSSAYSV